MSTLKTTNIAHPSSGSNNIVLDSSGNATFAGNATFTGNATFSGAGPNSFGMLPNLYVAAVRSGTPQTGLGTASDLIFNSELKDPYSLYDPATGIFTVTTAHVGTYLVVANITIFSLQAPSGESSFWAGIYKNASTQLQYQEIWETTNPDETASGFTISTIAQLTANGDNVKVRGQLSSSSGAKEMSINSSLTILRLF